MKPTNACISCMLLLACFFKLNKSRFLVDLMMVMMLHGIISKHLNVSLPSNLVSIFMKVES